MTTFSLPYGLPSVEGLHSYVIKGSYEGVEYEHAANYGGRLGSGPFSGIKRF